MTPTCFLWESQLHQIQPVHRSRWYPDIFDRVHLLFTQVHLLTNSSVEGQYITGVCRKETLKTWVLRKKIVVAFILGGYSGLLFKKKVCSKAFFLPPLVGGDGSVVRWLVDTFISVELLTGWVWHRSGRHGPLLNLFRNLPWTAKISLLDFLYSDLMDQIEGSGRLDDHQWKQ